MTGAPSCRRQETHVECIMNPIAFDLVDNSRHFPNTRPPCGREATRIFCPHETTLTPMIQIGQGREKLEVVSWYCVWTLDS